MQNAELLMEIKQRKNQEKNQDNNEVLSIQISVMSFASPIGSCRLRPKIKQIIFLLLMFFRQELQEIQE